MYLSDSVVKIVKPELLQAVTLIVIESIHLVRCVLEERRLGLNVECNLEKK